MTLTPSVMAAMDEAYRTGLGLRPEEHRRAATDALTRWHVFHVISRIPDAQRRDRPRGAATLRQQTIAWVDAYVSWSERHSPAAALPRTARHVVARLRRDWPVETHTITNMPAYRQRPA